MFELLDLLLALPQWLVFMTDDEQLVAALGAALPEARAGELMILGCEPSRLRLGDKGWSGSYIATAAPPGGGTTRSVRLRGTLVRGAPVVDVPSQPAPFGDPGWRLTLPDSGLVLTTEQPNADLPAVPVLTDPESARALLERAIGDAGETYNGYRLRGCRPTVARHKPGSRCTVLYRLEYDEKYADRAWPELVVAKTYRGGKGEVAWRGMHELWRSPMRHGPVRIAEPLAFLSYLNVLVQGPVPEDRTLKKAIRAAVASGGAAELDVVREAIRGAARGLAALHRSGVRYGEVVTWRDELGEMQRVIDRIGRHVPEAARAGSALLDRLATVAEQLPAGQPGPAHHSFRPEQVLLHGAEIGFVDFDAFCQAEPAADVAQFCASVRRLLEPPAHRMVLAGLAEEFLTEYERQAPVSRQRVALWEALELMTSLLHTWTKVKPDKAPEVLSALKAHLSNGLGWVGGLEQSTDTAASAI
jgi:hypothetical protein